MISSAFFRFCALAAPLFFCMQLSTAQPVVPSGSGSSALQEPTMWAVVIGVSSYKEPAIRPLQYAHADAQAFADYLRSDAAGTMPKQIRTLINADATLGAVDDALNWLKKSAKEGDVAMLYFAGHGDVEVAAVWQLGYLLTYDSPPNNFRNNAIRVEDLDLLAIELSSVIKARTIFILDACRAGTLAEGRSVPTENLSNQKANEVRILSCKPDQKSLEGANWGGGRGVFSYHLIRGLQGLANDESNTADLDMVTVEELTDYLRQTVVKDTKGLDPPQRQDPMIVAGTETFGVGFVVEEILARAAQTDDGEMAMASTSSGGRSMDDPGFVIQEQEEESPIDFLFFAGRDGGLIEHMDLSSFLGMDPQQIPQAIIAQMATVAHATDAPSYIQQKLDHFWEESGIDVNDQQAMAAFNIKMAIALHDRGQAIINSYLNADPDDMEERAIEKFETTKYRWYPDLFKLVMKLLPDGHPLIDRLAVKEAYFSGASIRILAVGQEDRSAAYAEAMALQQKALHLDPYAPYVHNELGILYKQLGQFDLAEKHFKEATTLAPSWGLPYSNLSALLIRQNRMDEAQTYATKALALVPNYATIHMHQGRIHRENGRFLEAEAELLRGIQLAPKHFAGYEHIGFLYQETAEFAKANENFIIAEELKKKLPVTIADTDADGVFDVLDLANFGGVRSIEELLELIKKTPDDPALHLELGMAYCLANQYENSIAPYLTVIRLDPVYGNVYDHLAWSYIKLSQYEHADRALGLAVERLEYNENRTMLIALLSELWGRWSTAETIYKEVIQSDSSLLIGYQKLGYLYEHLGRYQEAEDVFKIAKTAVGENGTNELYRFYLRMIDRMTGQVTWLLKPAFMLYEISMTMTDRLPPEFYIGTIHGVTTSPLDHKLVWEYFHYSHTAIGSPVHEDLVIWPTCAERTMELLNDAYPFLSTLGERADVLQKQGDIYLKLDDRDQAESVFERALALAPDQEDLRDKIVESYLARHQLSIARRHLVIQDSLNHLQFPTHLLLARMNTLNRNFVDGRRVINKALTLLPDEDQRRVLANLQAQNAFLEGNLDQAIRLYERNHQSDPERGVHAYAIARIHASRHDEKNAFKWLDKALDEGFDQFSWVLARDPWMNELRKTKKWGRMVKG